MPVNKRDTYSSVLKVSLPNRGYILAQHLLETIAIYPFLPKTEILKKLLEQKQSGKNKRIVQTLILLKKLNCIQNYTMITLSKVQNYMDIFKLVKEEDDRRIDSIISDVEEELNNKLAKAWKTFLLSKYGKIEVRLQLKKNINEDGDSTLIIKIIEKIGNKERYYGQLSDQKRN